MPVAPGSGNLAGDVAVVAADEREISCGYDAPDLLGDRGEDCGGGRGIGHERRDAMQSGLLSRDPLELFARSALVAEEALHPHRERGDARHPPE